MRRKPAFQCESSCCGHSTVAIECTYATTASTVGTEPVKQNIMGLLEALPPHIAEEAGIVGALSAAWLLLYLVVRHVLCPKYSADFSNRVVSLVHAGLGLVWPWFVLDMTRLHDNVGTATTPQQLTLLRVTFAYFFYDMLCCLAIKIDAGAHWLERLLLLSSSPVSDICRPVSSSDLLWTTFQSACEDSLALGSAESLSRCKPVAAGVVRALNVAPTGSA